MLGRIVAVRGGLRIFDFALLSGQGHGTDQGQCPGKGHPYCFFHDPFSFNLLINILRNLS
jgi:hypothetical protein